MESAEALSKDAVIDDNGEISSIDGGPCSFTSETKVETKQGEQAIGSLSVGEYVLAYNPKTKKMEYEPILHVWIHQDNDLVDLTITMYIHIAHSNIVTKTSEVIHTNQKHPFFTEEQGFVPVAHLKLGMHVLQADRRYGVITGWKIVPGAKTMYNLEVAQDHTFTVGSGQWVVHNCGSSPASDTSSSDQSQQAVNPLDRLNDVGPTIERIEDGVKFPHRNDGTSFLNREGRLPEPQQLTLFGDYYKEYVVPTPGVSGPGAQRLIYGAGGEIYYTADHYLTFEQLN